MARVPGDPDYCLVGDAAVLGTVSCRTRNGGSFRRLHLRPWPVLLLAYEHHRQHFDFIRHCRSLDVGLSDARTLLELLESPERAFESQLVALRATCTSKLPGHRARYSRSWQKSLEGLVVRGRLMCEHLCQGRRRSLPRGSGGMMPTQNGSEECSSKLRGAAKDTSWIPITTHMHPMRARTT